MLDTTRINDIRHPADRAFFQRVQDHKQDHMRDKNTAPKFIYLGKQEWDDYVLFARRNWMVNIYSHGNNWLAGLAVIKLEKQYHMEVSVSPMLHTDYWVKMGA